MADLNIKNPSVTEDALAIHLDASGNIDRISGHGLAGAGGGGGSMNYYGDDVYIKNTGDAGNIFTLTESVKAKLEQIQPSYTQGTDIIIDEYNAIKVNTNGSANSTGMAFVEGIDTIASGVASHAEGNGNAVYSDFSHIEGYNNTDYKIDGLVGANHTEGAYNQTSGVYSHNEGHANAITGYGVHVEGGYNKFNINNVSADTTHTDKTNRWNVWGISIEGMANATTAEPTSGSIDGDDYGYIHGGILKVIGNGTRTLTNPSDQSTEVINRSDALIIYRDGSISAAGNISANGIELGAGGGTSYQGRNGVNVNGGYIELTTTAYKSVSSVPSISNDVETLKTASGDWDKVSDKLDTTAFSEVSSTFLTAHQSLDEYATIVYANNASANALSEAETWVGNQNYLKEVPNTYALKTDIPTTVAQLTDSGNYYKTNETSGATQLSTEFAKYLTTSQYQTDSATFVTSSNASISAAGEQYALTTTGWAKVQAGQSLDAGSGISIDSDKINVKLGDNLKFTDSNNTTITTIDDISANSFNAINTDTENIYSKIDSRGFHHYDKNTVATTDVSLTNGGLEDTLTNSTRNISANYTLNHLFFKSSAANAYSQIEMEVFTNNVHKSQIILTDFDGTNTTTGLIDVTKIAAWDAAAGGGLTGVTTDNTLTGNGNTSTALGVAWSALSSYTIDYSNSAFNLTNGTSVSSFDQISAAIDSRYSKTACDNRYLRKSLDDTLTGDGTTGNKLGVAWSALSGNKIDSAKSADSAVYLTNGTNYSGFDDITGAINNKLNTNAIKTSAIGNTTYITAINTGSNDIPIKDTNFWDVNTTASTTAGNDNWQHYVTTSNTFNYYKMIVHPSGTTADNSWNNDNIIHIILEE